MVLLHKSAKYIKDFSHSKFPTFKMQILQMIWCMWQDVIFLQNRRALGLILRKWTNLFGPFQFGKFIHFFFWILDAPVNCIIIKAKEIWSKWGRHKLNSILSFLQFQGAPLEFSDVLADLNLIFTAMFTVECVLKISSFGPKVKTPPPPLPSSSSISRNLRC